MKIVKKLPNERPNHGDIAPGRQLVTLAAWLLLLVVFVYFAGEAIISRGVMYIPQNWEHKLFAQLVSSDQASKDETLNVHVQTLLNRIVKVTPEVNLSLTSKVISDDTPNAMALPGGLILVTDTLLKEALSENEITMVLAHEVGHFTLRHHLRRFGRLLIFPALGAVLLGDASVSSLVRQSSALVELSYSRHEELEADTFALDALNRVYGHVAGATDFFKRMTILDLSIPGGKYVSSHPLSDARVQSLSAQIAERGYRIEALSAKPAAF